MDLNLKNKKALVMGASQGIGRAIAESLANEGAQVIICARREPELAKVASEIHAAGFIVGDLSKPGEAARVTKVALDKLGGLDILVTNTGGPARGNFMDISSEQWLLDFQSLWLSAVDSFKTALPEMQKNKFGRLLLVTSMAGKEPLPGLTTSNGLRAGLEGLSRSMANEYSADGITINVLRPGYTNTERLKDRKFTEEQIKKMVPAGRLGEPRELADLACFLASPKAGYITGQCISVDGGVQRSH